MRSATSNFYPPLGEGSQSFSFDIDFNKYLSKLNQD
jgi:hypothetical protein